MRRPYRALAALLVLLFTLSLAACTGGSGESGGAAVNPSGGESHTNTQADSDEFQRNLHQNDQRSGIPRFLEADGGYYFSLGTLYYLDRETMQVTVVCAKPDCDHTDDAVCNARLDVKHLLTLTDRIYYDTSPRHPKQVWSVRQDATERQLVQELKSSENASAQSNSDIPIYHRGYLYYVSDDILYRVKLGGERDSAEAIWGPENAGATQSQGNILIYDPNAIHYTLWAEGETLYFMANVQGADGTYKDTLFRCDLTTLDVQRIWETPGADQVGEWETTGVYVSQWYIKEGTLYFYLSGGDLWRTDLSTGRTEKLADTHEKTLYGSAVFSDEVMCLLNDTPMFNGEVYPGSYRRTQGDTVYLYGLDGTFRKEISLQSLYDEMGEISEIDLLFCDTTDLYFLTTSYTYGDPNNPTLATGRSRALCHTNFETGASAVLYRFAT